jgi:helicase MOV-10
LKLRSLEAQQLAEIELLLLEGEQYCILTLSKVFLRNDQRRFVFKGPRPQVPKRRDAPPHFLPNFDVPTALVNGIRLGTDILKIIPALTAELTEDNYFHKMTALLFCEEVALGIEIEQFTMKDVTLEHINGNHFSLEITGLKNDSPPLGIADLLIITVNQNETIEFHAFIHTIRHSACTVIFQMSDVFSEKHRSSPVTVKFTLNRYPIRTMQNVLKGLGRELSFVTLFPSPTNFYGLVDRRRFQWSQPYQVTASMISGLNEFQHDAVLSVLDGAGLFHPKIIFGPAGTGKTRTMVELARIIITCSSARVLIVAPSNSAADILLARLSEALGERAEKIICRWNALRRNNEALSENCKKYSKDDNVKDARCVISTCLATSSLPRRKFDFLLGK